MTWHPDIPNEFKNKIVTGDARELAKQIPNESIDLIFTDPPYIDNDLWTFEWLAKEGSRILKPSGSLITYVGKNHFQLYISCLSKHLTYYWIIAGIQLNGNDRFWSRKIMGCWRPLLFFVKDIDVYKPNWIVDARRTNRDKKFHKWGQGIDLPIFYINKLLADNEIMFDPFVGGGTFAAACKILDRKYIAFEIDPETAELARERVLNTQPPLFVLEPEQLELQES